MIIRKLQVIIMLKQLVKNVNQYFDQALTGLAIIAVGIFLLIDKNYFSWPPNFKPIMNSDYMDFFFILLGIVLLIFVVIGDINGNNLVLKVRKIFIVISGGAVSFLFVEQLCQVFFAHNFEMTIAVIFDVFLFILIFRCAYKS